MESAVVSKDTNIYWSEKRHEDIQNKRNERIQAGKKVRVRVYTQEQKERAKANLKKRKAEKISEEDSGLQQEDSGLQQEDSGLQQQLKEAQAYIIELELRVEDLQQELEASRNAQAQEEKDTRPLMKKDKLRGGYKAYSELSTNARKKVHRKVKAAAERVMNTACKRKLTDEEKRKVIALIASYSYGIKIKESEEVSPIEDESITKVTIDALNKIWQSKDIDFKTKRSVQIQLLSLLTAVPSMTKETIEFLLGRKSISPALFTEVNHHKRNNGPGMYVPIKKPHRRNVKFRLGEIQALAEFLDCYCTKTALTRSVISDNGETILIPLVYKTVSTERLVSLFFKARAKEKIQTGEIAASFVIGTRHSNTKITISHEKVRNIVNYLAPGNLQCLTCLDSMSQRDGAENFVNMKRIINYLQNSIVDSDANLEMLASKALNIIAKAELFAKSRENGIWTNAHAKERSLSRSATPWCESGHVHAGVCLDCEVLLQVQPSLNDVYIRARDIAASNMNQPEREKQLNELDLINTNITWFSSRYKNYLGHQYRLIHESDLDESIVKMLKENTNRVWINLDYAMRYLAKSFRESQSCFFGKRGFTWWGSKLVWYDPDQNKFLFYYLNVIPNIDKEDAYLSAQCIQAALENHHKICPTHNSVIVSSDGAGAFSGIEFMSRLWLLNMTKQWEVVFQSTGESGGNKSDLDTEFGVSKFNLDVEVKRLQGEGNIECAEDLARMLQMINTPHTITIQLEINTAGMQSRVKSGAGYALQSHALRVMTYDGCRPRAIKCWSHSGLSDQEPQLRTDTPDCTILPENIWTAEQLANLDKFLVFGKIHGNHPIEELGRVGGIGTFKTREDRESEKEAKVVRTVAKVQVKRQKALEAEAIANNFSETEFKCPTSGCARVFRYKKMLDKHLERGDCNVHGGRFCSGKKEHRVAPDENAILTDREYALKCFLNSLQSNSTDITSVYDANVTNDDPSLSQFSFGFSKRFNVSHPALGKDIKELIITMFKRGNLAVNPKENAKEMQMSLRAAGTLAMADKYGHHTLFGELYRNSNGSKVFSEHVIPEQWRINILVNSESTKMKAEAKESMRPVMAETAFRAQMKFLIDSDEGLERELSLEKKSGAVKPVRIPITVDEFLEKCIETRCGLDNPRPDKVLAKDLNFLGSEKAIRVRIIANVFHKLEVTGSSVMAIVTNDKDDEDSDLDH